MKRLTPAALTLIMFGVVGLLVAAYVAKNLLAVDNRPAAPPTRNIPMAVADIEPGTVITESHLGQGPYPVDQLERDTLLVNRVVVGRIAKEKIPAAQPIRANQLYKPGELPPLQVAEGKRAVAIDIGESVSMVDGMVKPGEYVDVLFTYNGPLASDDSFQGGVTMRLFEGIRLLAINRNITQGRIERGGNRVTLELTEPQANVIVLAKERGTLTLTYNPKGPGSGGLALSNAERVTLYEILGLRPQQPEPEPFLSESYRGVNRAVYLFNDRGRRLDNYTPPPTDRNRMVLPPASDAAPSTAPQAAPRQPAAPEPERVPGGNSTRPAPTASRPMPGPQ